MSHLGLVYRGRRRLGGGCEGHGKDSCEAHLEVEVEHFVCEDEQDRFEIVK